MRQVQGELRREGSRRVPVLAKGDYEICHVMDGSDPIMIFRQLNTKKPVEVRAKCALLPLTDKVSGDQRIYLLNAANERVLSELIFKGEHAKHVC